MGLMSTADFPVYAPKVLGSRRLARLINSKCVVAEQSRLSEELEESISAGEKALASGDKTGEHASCHGCLAPVNKSIRESVALARGTKHDFTQGSYRQERYRLPCVDGCRGVARAGGGPRCSIHRVFHLGFSLAVRGKAAASSCTSRSFVDHGTLELQTLAPKSAPRPPSPSPLDLAVALASLESATMTLAKLGMTPTTKIGLTSLPGRAYELQRQLV